MKKPVDEPDLTPVVQTIMVKEEPVVEEKKVEETVDLNKTKTTLRRKKKKKKKEKTLVDIKPPEPIVEALDNEDDDLFKLNQLPP